MKFTLSRSKTVATLSGHAIQFVKGEPTHVPKEAWDEVIAIGAVPEDDIPEDAEKANAPQDPHERREKLFAAFDEIVLRNDRNDFSATGVPGGKAVEKLVGFKVDNRERLTAWEAFKDTKDEKGAA